MWRPALSTHFLHRYSVTLKYFRRTVTSAQHGFGSKDGFTPVYTLPYINYARLINRTKFYQTCVAATGSTISFALYEAGSINFPALYSTIYLLFALNLPFYTLGVPSTNLVGRMYISDDQKMVKIAYLSFWGKRKDEVIQTEDLVPLSEISGNHSHMYFKIERYSQPCKFKLSLKYGKIENSELFTKIFGNL